MAIFGEGLCTGDGEICEGGVDDKGALGVFA
jgi:hypothetical protein